ncbi:uncharacterized protein METZ01_LOCUS289246, partial [marine metagenome]
GRRKNKAQAIPNQAGRSARVQSRQSFDRGSPGSHPASWGTASRRMVGAGPQEEEHWVPLRTEEEAPESSNPNPQEQGRHLWRLDQSGSQASLAQGRQGL